MSAKRPPACLLACLPVYPTSCLAVCVSVSLSLSVPMCTVHKIWVRNGMPWYVYLCADDEETLSVPVSVRMHGSVA